MKNCWKLKRGIKWKGALLGAFHFHFPAVCLTTTSRKVEGRSLSRGSPLFLLATGFWTIFCCPLKFRGTGEDSPKQWAPTIQLFPCYFEIPFNFKGITQDNPEQLSSVKLLLSWFSGFLQRECGPFQRCLQGHKPYKLVQFKNNPTTLGVGS